MRNQPLAVAGGALGTLGLYTATGLAIAGSAFAAPVLLVCIPAGAALAIAGGRS